MTNLFWLSFSSGAEIKKEDLQKQLAEYTTEVSVKCFLKPCSLTGDFDGDKMQDRAILVSKNKLKGIAVLFGNNKYYLIAAGNQYTCGNCMKGTVSNNLTEVVRWKVRKAKQAIAEDNRVKEIKNDFISITLIEESSGDWLYWASDRFVAYRLFD